MHSCKNNIRILIIVQSLRKTTNSKLKIQWYQKIIPRGEGQKSTKNRVKIYKKRVNKSTGEPQLIATVRNPHSKAEQHHEKEIYVLSTGSGGWLV